MAHFIEVTRYDNKKALVNLDYVAGIDVVDGCTGLMVAEDDDLPF